MRHLEIKKCLVLMHYHKAYWQSIKLSLLPSFFLPKIIQKQPPTSLWFHFPTCPGKPHFVQSVSAPSAFEGHVVPLQKESQMPLFHTRTIHSPFWIWRLHAEM